MSNSGASPTQRRTRYTPQSTDPVNPLDGDLFFSDGTPRAEGLWVWFNAAWQQVSTSGALSTVNDLTFIPQAADPGVPTTGMVFYADGTSRTEGLWIYDGTDWQQLSGVRWQEFTLNAAVTVRVATTANLILASQVENGDTIDGVVLVTGNLVLVKNQTIASENGVYVVQVSGSPIRDVSADTFQELNNYVATVTSGTVNADTIWFQTATLTSLADAQVWAATPGAKTFTVPGGVTQLHLVAAGGGGGGGGGGGVDVAGRLAGAGGGGGGSPIVETTIIVIPGDVLTITPGLGAVGGTAGSAAGSNGGIGASGGSTTITGTGVSITVLGGGGGGFGGGGNATAALGGTGGDNSYTPGGAGGVSSIVNRGGGGGGGGGQQTPGVGGSTASIIGAKGYLNSGGGGGYGTISNIGGAGGKSIYVATGAPAGAPFSGTSGGGGGASIATGATGGSGGGGGPTSPAPSAAINSAAGGGGGGGSFSGGGGNTGAKGGRGGTGYVRLSW